MTHLSFRILFSLYFKHFLCSSHNRRQFATYVAICRNSTNSSWVILALAMVGDCNTQLLKNTHSLAVVIIISNDAAIKFKCNRTSQHKPITTWRFNIYLLKDPKFDSYVKRDWAPFLQINDSPESSHQQLLQHAENVIKSQTLPLYLSNVLPSGITLIFQSTKNNLTFPYGLKMASHIFHMCFVMVWSHFPTWSTSTALRVNIFSNICNSNHSPKENLSLWSLT